MKTPFTEREARIVELISDGNTSAEIALVLRVSVLAVQKARNAINNKIGIHSREALLEKFKTTRRLRKFGVLGMSHEQLKERMEANALINALLSEAGVNAHAARKSFPKDHKFTLELLGKASTAIERAAYEIKQIKT